MAPCAFQRTEGGIGGAPALGRVRRSARVESETFRRSPEPFVRSQPSPEVPTLSGHADLGRRSALSDVAPASCYGAGGAAARDRSSREFPLVVVIRTMMLSNSPEPSTARSRHRSVACVVRGRAWTPGRVSRDMRSAANAQGQRRNPAGRRRRPPSSRPTSDASRQEDGRLSPVPVLYVGGCQRSGSTLLDRMMSQVSGHVSAGEIVHLWSRGLRSDELCGCGERFSACPFWNEVGRVGVRGVGVVGPRRGPQTAAKGRPESLHHLHVSALPVAPISERVGPVRGCPGSALPSGSSSGWGCRRGFVEARLDGVPSSAGPLGSPPDRPPGTRQPRCRVLAIEARSPAGVRRRRDLHVP